MTTAEYVLSGRELDNICRAEYTLVNKIKSNNVKKTARFILSSRHLDFICLAESTFKNEIGAELCEKVLYNYVDWQMIKQPAILVSVVYLLPRVSRTMLSEIKVANCQYFI